MDPNIFTFYLGCTCRYLSNKIGFIPIGVRELSSEESEVRRRKFHFEGFLAFRRSNRWRRAHRRNVPAAVPIRRSDKRNAIPNKFSVACPACRFYRRNGQRQVRPAGQLGYCRVGWCVPAPPGATPVRSGASPGSPVCSPDRLAPGPALPNLLPV